MVRWQGPDWAHLGLSSEAEVCWRAGLVGSSVALRLERHAEENSRIFGFSLVVSAACSARRGVGWGGAAQHGVKRVVWCGVAWAACGTKTPDAVAAWAPTDRGGRVVSWCMHGRGGVSCHARGWGAAP